jgi:hypothetical protein
MYRSQLSHTLAALPGSILGRRLSLALPLRSSILFMPAYCQRCGKKFHDTARVLNHMNQPISSCRTYYEELLQIAETAGCRPELVQSSDRPHEMDGSAGGSSRSSPISRPHTPMVTDEDPMIDTTSESSPNSPFFTEFYPGASKIFGSGPTFMDNFDNDEFSKERQVHSHYPFSSKEEWHMASFLLRSGLSMAAMDQFFKLELVSDLLVSFHIKNQPNIFKVKKLGLSFSSAKDLRNRAEMLPSGPPWMCKLLQTEYPTKNKIYLYYRDPIECLRSLLRSPLLKDHLDFTPRRLFENAEKLVRVYTEWLSGDAAWAMQVSLILQCF